MASAHPTDLMLLDYATGAGTPGMDVLCASHLTFCPECRARVASFEHVGAEVLGEELNADGSDGMALDDVLARLDEAEDAPPRKITAPSPFPRPLVDAVGMAADDIPWRFRMPGLRDYRLDGFDDEEVSLLRAKPGSIIPSHTHTGQEATLVLTGALEDDGKVYRQGDVAAADHDHDHRPRIIGDEICICLIVLGGELRFTGRLGRLLNMVGG